MAEDPSPSSDEGERASADPGGRSRPAKKKRRKKTAPAGPPKKPGSQKAASKRSSAKKPREPRDAPTERRLGERAPGIYRGLASWLEERLEEELPDGGAPDSIELTIRMPFVRDRRRWRRAEREFRAAFENQLDALCDQWRTEELGYRDGHVFCPWCASPVCEHSTPPDPRAIFIGYNPTGVPLWRDFGSWLLERGDEQLDRLYTPKPTPLARRIDAEELVGDLLPEFGEAMRPLTVVGAVVLGYFTLPQPKGPPSAIALSAVALERRLPSGAPRYTVNLVSNLPPPHHLPTLLAERIVPPLSDWAAVLRRELAGVTDRLIEAQSTGRRLSAGESRTLVERALEVSAQYLEKRLRRRSGRTDHAEERSHDPERPTASALSDAFAAKDDSLFYDRRERTVIVRGPHNRIHVFRGDGTHITSILYTGEAIRDRLAVGRWVPLEATRITALRKGLKERRQLDPPAESSESG